MNHTTEEKLLPIVFLKGPRVTLRPLLREDIPLLMRYMNDPDVLHFLGSNSPKMEADEMEWFDGLHKRKQTDIVLSVVADDHMIGVMGIHGMNWVHRFATTGAAIGDKAYWGRGYGSEAKILLLKFAFDTLNLRKICSNVIAFNERSLNYSLKCGYKEEGRRKDHFFRQGRYWDEIQLAIFREDWVPVWEKFAAKHSIPK